MCGGRCTNNQAFLQHFVKVELEIYNVQGEESGVRMHYSFPASDFRLSGALIRDTWPQTKSHGHGPVSGLPTEAWTRYIFNKLFGIEGQGTERNGNNHGFVQSIRMVVIILHLVAGYYSGRALACRL